MLKLMGKKIFTILRSKILFKPVDMSYFLKTERCLTFGSNPLQSSFYEHVVGTQKNCLNEFKTYIKIDG